MTEATEIASRKKRRLYLLLLIFQILVVFYPMFLLELIDQKRTHLGFGFVALTQTIIVIILITVNTLFIREFIKSKKVFYLVCTVYCISFVISALIHSVPQIAG